jgi:hypothetical protein
LIEQPKKLLGTLRGVADMSLDRDDDLRLLGDFGPVPQSLDELLFDGVVLARLAAEDCLDQRRGLAASRRQIVGDFGRA